MHMQYICIECFNSKRWQSMQKINISLLHLQHKIFLKDLDCNCNCIISDCSTNKVVRNNFDWCYPIEITPNIHQFSFRQPPQPIFVRNIEKISMFTHCIKALSVHTNQQSVDISKFVSYQTKLRYLCERCLANKTSKLVCLKIQTD